jgi:ribose transport system ATP-binding protein
MGPGIVALRAQDLSLAYGDTCALRGASFALLAGEACCLAGLGPAGQQAVVDFLSGECSRMGGWVSVGGEAISGDRIRDPARAGVFRPSPLPRRGYDVTLLEDLFLFRPGGLGRFFWNQVSRVARAKALFSRVGLGKPPQTDVRTLSQLEYARLQLAKALDLGARIVILDDDMLALASEDRAALDSLIAELKAEGIAFIVKSDAPPANYAFIDKVLLFKDERLVKKLDARTDDEAGVTGYLAEAEPPAIVHGTAVPGPSLRIDRLSAPGLDSVSFELAGGCSLNLVHYEIAARNELFARLTGMAKDPRLEVFLGGRKISPLSPETLIRRRTAIVGPWGGALVEKLSIEDNLALPILRKTSAAGILYDGKAGQALFRQLSQQDESLPGRCEDCSPIQLVEVALERWLAFGPRAVIMLDPLEHRDDRCTLLVRGYVERFLARGAAVLIVSSSLRHYEGLCDRGIQMTPRPLQGGRS